MSTQGAGAEFAARHTQESPDWYTPDYIIAAAREVLGLIYLDPASEAEANARPGGVGAYRYYSVADDGLSQRWNGTVFLNPPGGQVIEFWQKLIHEPIDAAIWIGYSLEQLQTLQQASLEFTPLDFPTCILNKRIPFVENAAKREARHAKEIAAGKTPKAKTSPSHGNYVTYLGPDVERFKSAFATLGQVVWRF